MLGLSLYHCQEVCIGYFLAPPQLTGNRVFWLCFDGDLHFDAHFQTDFVAILGGESVLDANLSINRTF